MNRKSDFAEIPKGFCQCGCGGKTNIAKWTNKKRGLIKGEPNKFINRHARWRGGKFIDGNYVKVYMPSHLRAVNNYVREHILIAEKALGKSLPAKAVIHHHTSEQLVVCQDASYHKLLHQRTRAYKACGHAHWLKCPYCKKYDDLSNMYVHPTKLAAYHRDCHNRYAKTLYVKRFHNGGI
jgi:hypothetical protein